MAAIFFALRYVEECYSVLLYLNIINVKPKSILVITLLKWLLHLRIDRNKKRKAPFPGLFS